MFKAQSVAITGAQGGIGRALAEMFISNGANVSISDLRDPKDVGKKIGAVSFKCDVSNENDIKNFILGSENINGPIDIFVSNAGVGYGDPKHAADASNEYWELSWKINVMSSVYASRCLIPGMRKRGSGRFVITASAAGLLSQIGSSSYTATKHAAVGFAESLAIRHWDEGIKTHCICPQYVKTNMTKGMLMAEGHQDGLLEPEDVAEALKNSISEDKFMVLSHPVVGDYFKNKANNYEAYIRGMNKLKQKLGSNQLPD